MNTQKAAQQGQWQHSEIDRQIYVAVLSQQTGRPLNRTVKTNTGTITLVSKKKDRKGSAKILLPKPTKPDTIQARKIMSANSKLESVNKEINSFC